MVFDSNILFGRWRYCDDDFSIEKVLDLMKKHCIDKAMAVSTKGIFYDDYDGNDETLAICNKHKNLFPVGIVNLSKFIDVDNEIEKRKAQGFKAFRIFNEYLNVDFGSLVFKSFLRILTKHSMPLIVSGRFIATEKSQVDEIALAVSDSSIPVIVLDASGYWLTEVIAAATYSKNLYFSTRLFNISNAIERFCAEIGHKKLVLGTGMPFFYGNQSIYPIRTANISEQEKEDIIHNNIEETLGGSDEDN